jgi:DNA modification methylase
MGVAVVAHALQDSSNKGELVLDPFGGCGTTMLAAQKTQRRARLIEIDPHNCDLIVRRWQEFSGDVARLSVSGVTFADVAASRAGAL